MQPDKIVTIEDARTWSTYHEAQINAWWHEQWKANAELRSKLSKIETRLTKLEGRVIAYSASAAMVGAFFGPFIIGKLMGTE